MGTNRRTTMATPGLDLKHLTNTFVNELVVSLSFFVDPAPQFEVTELKEKISIRHTKQSGISEVMPLKVDGKVFLGLEARFDCIWDSRHTSLAIERSSFEVRPLANKRGDPLFRVDYEREQNKDYPTSHIHVHAHRDEFTHRLGHAGQGSRPSRRRINRELTDIPKVSEFHFPTGGSRFRPCLEDILEALRVEFGLDVDNSAWSEHLKETRAKWRRVQTAAAVRDCPQAAIDVLVKDFGLVLPDGWVTPPEKVDKLTTS